jgi:hypothetical protein
MIQIIVNWPSLLRRPRSTESELRYMKSDLGDQVQSLSLLSGIQLQSVTAGLHCHRESPVHAAGGCFRSCHPRQARRLRSAQWHCFSHPSGVCVCVCVFSLAT